MPLLERAVALESTLSEPLSDQQSTPLRDRLADAVAWLMWRVNRLRCMSVVELSYRVRRAMSVRVERYRLLGSIRVPIADLSARSAVWLTVPPSCDRAVYMAAAERLAAGTFDVFALEGINLGSPPRWNRDPKSGIEAPLDFGKSLDYRDASVVGDIKYLWEPNRHLHLVTLAQAYALSGEKKYFDVLRRHLESWFVACPYGMGANWSSALEAGIRLINWSIAWQLLGGVRSVMFHDLLTMEFRRRWLESIHQHACFIRGYFSLHSSANNHLIGEASGLFIAAVTWPYWPEAAVWRAESRNILEREARLQNAPDGVNREQAVSYQQFELDLLLLPLLAGEANGVSFSPEYSVIIERMMDYLASMMDVGGNMPMFGDADDGMAFRLDPRVISDPSGRRYRSSLATGAIIFQRRDFKNKAGGLDDTTRWLLGAAAEDGFRSLDRSSPRPLPVRNAFPEGGSYVMGCDFEAGSEVRLIVDAGPLGYQRIAAHGHADALSFTLSVGGQEFLIDPGTFAYHTQGPWRQYFRGTGAHNTLRVDGLDQSVSGGNFMWLSKATTVCDVWQTAPEDDVFEGWHDGYRQLSDPVIHRRRITFDKRTRRVFIQDSVRMEAPHDIELLFHCSEGCHVESGSDSAPDTYVLSQGATDVRLKLPAIGGASHRTYRGSTDPIFGWVSRRFDIKEPATTIVWSARLTGSFVLCSEIWC